MAHVTVRGVDQTQRALKSVHFRLFPKRGGPVLSGLKAGAYVIRKEWRSQIDRQVSESQAAGSDYQPTGLMKKSVRIYRMKRPQRIGATECARVTIDPKATYQSGERVAAVAGILEHGHSNMPAKAIVRKTVAASESQAIAAIKAGIEAKLQKILAKL